MNVPRKWNAVGVAALYAALALSLLPPLYVWVFRQPGRLKSLVRESRGVLAYRGDAAGHRETPVWESSPRYFQSLDLRIGFCIDSLPADFANVFQTADGNSGLRLEVTHDGLLGVLVGDEGRQDELPFRPVLFPLRLGTWHTLQVTIRDGRARICYDGRLWSRLPGVVRIGASRFLLGNGFDGTRPLFGKAVLLQLEAETGTYQPPSVRERVLHACKLAALGLPHVVLLLVLFRTVRRRSRANTPVCLPVAGPSPAWDGPAGARPRRMHVRAAVRSVLPSPFR